MLRSILKHSSMISQRNILLLKGKGADFQHYLNSMSSYIKHLIIVNKKKKKKKTLMEEYDTACRDVDIDRMRVLLL